MDKMRFQNVAVLTSEESWFVSYAQKLVEILREEGYQSELFHDHQDIEEAFQVVFTLSYFNLIKKQFLKKHKHNLVVHESRLPQGKGWAPLFWQILEGKNKIPVVLFEAAEDVDAGNIYISDYIVLQGHELHDEIRELQARKSVELCLEFLENYENLRPVSQTGKETFYARRTPGDSELNINKSISEQFNLLRIVNNEEFPAFFYRDGHKYIVKIFEDAPVKRA
jgi:methionyl-tRNA formyltransferase